jgi:hypothetical protein
MSLEPGHLSDEEILLLLDGESSSSTAKDMQAHMVSCWSCRARMGSLEAVIRVFVSQYRGALDPLLPDPKGPAALLRARLREPSDSVSTAPPARWQLPMLARTLGLAAATFLLALLGGRLIYLHSQTPVIRETEIADRSVPNRTLTPGATRPVRLSDVCAMPHEEVIRAVSTDLQRKVFEEYGIANPRVEDYEVDYLIAPGLGGTDDIHNLWPEPSTPSPWNAHKKDELEERLHQMVCDGELELTTAQRAIANDWIAAYEEYCAPQTAVVRRSRFRRD